MLAGAIVDSGFQNKAKFDKAKRRLVPKPLAQFAGDMEQCFAEMVCDGMALGEAFTRAGFKATNGMDATRLWRSERIQGLAKGILEARRQTGAVTLPEVTSMLQRVYAGAMAIEDYGPAHNAAFSLARLYGMVVDRAQIEHIRRPARNPDAPAEQDMGSWIASLPSLSISANPQGSSLEGSKPLIDQGFSSLPSPDGIQLPARQIGNGAPTEPVTGTPNLGARTAPDSSFGYAERYPEVIDHIANPPPSPPVSKRVPRRKKKVPGRKKGAKRSKKLPTAKQLFG